MFTIIWKYRVIKEQCQLFEANYGPAGPWHKLFSQDPNYIGTDLHISTQNEGEYLLIDKWKSESAYQQFLKKFEFQYTSLSHSLEMLYLSEEKVGEYELKD